MIEISKEQIDRTLFLTQAIQQIPSPTFNEAQRSRFIAHQFSLSGVKDMQTDSAGNILARIPGGDKSPLVISAHLDTVHPLEIDLNLIQNPDSIIGPGIGDNALGLAGLLFIAQSLTENNQSLPGDLWLIANVGEEGLGNLSGARAFVERFKDLPQAYLIVEGMGLGQIFHRGLGVIRYRITLRSPGGHSWADFGNPSAIHEISRLTVKLADLYIPSSPRTALNVGIIKGGTSINTIAAEASIEVDLRSEDSQTLNSLSSQVVQLANEMKNQNVTVEISEIGRRPAGGISIDHPLVKLAQETLNQLGVPPKPGIASTDANIPLSMGYPAICIGLTNGAKAHTLQEYIEISPLEKGLKQLYHLVTHAWEGVR